MSQGFNELRNAVFAKVEQRAVRQLALAGVPPSAFAVAALPSRAPHRRTGARGRARHRRRSTSCCRSCCSTSIPTLIEILIVCGILWRLYDWRFAAVTFATIVLYVAFTFAITDWRVRFRREMNERDSEANSKSVDAPAQFRDGQILRQRRARGGALRPRARRPTSTPRSRARRRWRCSMSARARSSPAG